MPSAKPTSFRGTFRGYVKDFALSTTFQSFFAATLKRGRRNSRNAAAKSLAESPRDKICWVTLPPWRPPSRLSADLQRVSLSERSASLGYPPIAVKRSAPDDSVSDPFAPRTAARRSPGRGSHAPADPTTRRLFTYTPPDCTSRRASLLDGASCTRATDPPAPMPAVPLARGNVGRRHILEHRQHVVHRQRRDVLPEQQRRRMLGARRLFVAVHQRVTSRASTRCASRAPGCSRSRRRRAPRSRRDRGT